MASNLPGDAGPSLPAQVEALWLVQLSVLVEAGHAVLAVRKS